MEQQLFTTAKDIVLRTYPETKCFAELYTCQFDIEGRHTLVKVDIHKQIVMIYSYLPDYYVTGKDPIKRLVKFIARINELLYIGNLEYNSESGEVRYKTSQIMLRIQDPSSIIQFLLEQHKNHFEKLARGLKELRNKASDPTMLANQLFSY